MSRRVSPEIHKEGPTDIIQHNAHNTKRYFQKTLE